MTWRAGHAALVLSLPRGLTLDNNDLGGRFHRKLTSLRVPRASVKVLLTMPVEGRPWLEVGEIVTDAYLDIYSSPSGWHEMAEAQVAFVEQQDRLTGRARRMFGVLQPSNGTNSGEHRGIHLFLPLTPSSTRPSFTSEWGTLASTNTISPAKIP